MEDNLIFRIGEFSRIAQVSGRLLRYYEEIGLFYPVYTEPSTGNRFYSAQQLPRLNRILALKDLGFSLEQIARLLDDVSEDELRGMLIMREAQIEQTVQQEVKRLNTIRARIKGIDSTDYATDVIVKAIPTQPFLSIRNTYPSLDHAQQFWFRIQAQLPENILQSENGYFTVVLHSDIYEMENVDIEMGFPVAANATDGIFIDNDNHLNLKTLPAVEYMATIVRTGRIDRAYLSYGAIGLWAEANHYHLAGAAREVYLQPPVPGKPGATVVEIQFPVRRAI